MPYKFGNVSLRNLEKCHKTLQTLAERALGLTVCDFTILSSSDFYISFQPYPPDSSIEKYRAVADAFKKAAADSSVVLRWSGDFKALGNPAFIEVDLPGEGDAVSMPGIPEPRAVPSRSALADLSDAELLARVIWGECRGKLHDEACAIAHVVVNRAAKPCWWGTSVKDCCLKAKQFSCLNESDPNLSKILAGNFKDGSWLTCFQEADAALSGRSSDPTNGATSYHAASMRPFPSWAKTLTQTAKIGSHIFYR